LFRSLVSPTAIEYVPGSRCCTAAPAAFVKEIDESSTRAFRVAGGGVPTEN
jgi:hypothetical protein